MVTHPETSNPTISATLRDNIDISNMDASLVASNKRRGRHSNRTRYRFTPVQSSKKALRLWDRKPVTPFAARSKSHKVWKRFLASTTTDIGGDQILMDGQNDYGDEIYQTEINEAGCLRDLRGIKRLRIATGVEMERGRSFLETKWEMESGARRRKYAPRQHHRSLDFKEGVCSRRRTLVPYSTAPQAPELPLDANEQASGPPTNSDAPRTQNVPATQDIGSPSRIDVLTDSKSAEQNNHVNTCESIKRPIDFAQDVCEDEISTQLHGDIDSGSEMKLHDAATTATTTPASSEGWQDVEATRDIVEGQERDLNMDALGNGEMERQIQTAIDGNQETAELPNSVQEAEDAGSAKLDNTEPTEELAPGKPVSSTSRLPTLEGDDAQLLSEFLSRAKAKRSAAKSGMVHRDSDAKSETVSQQSPTPRARRVLEDLDRNSPSSPRVQLSPSKLRQTPLSPSPLPKSMKQHEEEDARSKDEDEPQTSTRSRRSTRTHLPKPQRHVPRVPNQIPVRRSKGTEFVFLQKSEAQQLSLLTKANTRKNKGNAQLPHLALPEIHANESKGFDENHNLATSHSPHKLPRKGGCNRKTVTWDEERLVQFEGEIIDETDMMENHGSPEPTAPQNVKRVTPATTGTNETQRKEISQATTASIKPSHQFPKSPVPTRKIRKLGSSSATHSFSSSAAPLSLTTPATGSPDSPRIQRKKVAPTKSQKKLLSFKVSETTVATKARHGSTGNPRTRSSMISGTPISKKTRANAL